METINAYYNGQAFVPTNHVQIKKNQLAIVTILDEASEESSATAMKQAIRKLCGAFEGIGLSSDEFSAQKLSDKGMEL